jgi:GTPase SAR1 family protein
MEQRRHLKAKICLVGEAAVGKTSLIRRYVESHFSDAYLMTIGVKV